MALGDLIKFEEFSADISNIHDLGADVFKMALLTSLTTPTAADATPNLADYTQVTAGGNYTAGGVALAGVTYTEVGGVATFDANDLTIAKHASNPTNARWGLLINSTQGNAAVAYLDLGSDFDMTTGDLVFTFNASGILTVG